MANATTPATPQVSNATVAKSAAPVAAPVAQAQAPKEEMFQSYNSSRDGIRIITDKGIRVNFAAHRYVTQDPAVIEYLDREIAAKSLPGVSKGELLASSDLDPMEALRKKIIADYLEKEVAKKAAIAAGDLTDFGNTENAPGLKVTTSSQVAS
jgi:hypothetical protein